MNCMSFGKASEGLSRVISKQPKQTERSYPSTSTKLPLDEDPAQAVRYINKMFNPPMTDPNYVMPQSDAKFLSTVFRSWGLAIP